LNYHYPTTWIVRNLPFRAKVRDAGFQTGSGGR
jgi:hypothetical protein